MVKVLLYQSDSGGNPYLYEVGRILRQQNVDVSFDSASFWNMEGDYQIINLQWPEELFDWNEPTDDDLQKLKSTLEFWKSKSKIVVTRHNVAPHNAKHNQQYIKLYNIVLSAADGILHMGEFSRREYMERYKDESFINNQKHGIVPHPIYTTYENTVTKSEARNELGIPQDKTVILIFGTIRNEEEKQLIKHAFSNLNIKNKYLLISYFPLKSFKGSRYFKSLFRWWLNLTPNQKKFYDNVPFEKVQYFLNASDILLIHRKHNLNSGLVFLGFAYAKAIVGPAVNNIKEVLEKTKNYLFDPSKPDTAVKALQQACQEAPDTEVIKENIRKNYSSEDDIGKNYLKLFLDLIDHQ